MCKKRLCHFDRPHIFLHVMHPDKRTVPKHSRYRRNKRPLQALRYRKIQRKPNHRFTRRAKQHRIAKPAKLVQAANRFQIVLISLGKPNAWVQYDLLL